MARLQAAEHAGLLEMSAMFANITPLYDTAQLIESLQDVGRLRRELGVEIRHAMNCDVNGQNWGLVDLLLDAGVEGLTMAINPHFGGTPETAPGDLPVGRAERPAHPRLLRLALQHRRRDGHPRDAAHLREFWPQQQAYLDEIGWPLPILMIQHTHPFTDNGTADPCSPTSSRSGTPMRGAPRLVIATPTMWWEAVKAYHDLLPVWRGDWTDFWNFGRISSAREQTVNRMSRARLFAADALRRLRSTGNAAIAAPTSHARHRARPTAG